MLPHTLRLAHVANTPAGGLPSRLAGTARGETGGLRRKALNLVTAASAGAKDPCQARQG
jgi:hypothetical protein